MPNLYDEDTPPPAEQMSAGAGQTAEGDEGPKEAQEGPTALLPKSILAGKDFKEGEEVVLRIEKVYPDQVEVSYASDHDEGAEGEKADGEMDEKSSNPMYD